MQPQTVNIKDLTIDQLKAYAYDTLVKIQFEQQNLARLEAELSQRSSSPEPSETPAEVASDAEVS